GDVPPEDRIGSRQNVHVRDGSSDVHQRDNPAGLDRVVRLVGVLKGERVHVDQGRGLPDLGDDARVVADLVFLDRDQENVHRLAARRVEDDVVEVDVVD